jgi:hypothetical protein
LENYMLDPKGETAMKYQQTVSEMDNLSGDLILGAAAIAAFLGTKRRRTYQLASKGSIPTFKLGHHLAARKSTLLKYIVEREQAGVR